MRQIVLDTETTGLDPAMGHRIIEIAAVELVNRRLTNNHFHRYINPERDSEEAALRVHGLTREFLSDKPKFREVASELLDFIRDAELIIHNAAFDIAFVDYELGLLNLKSVATCCSNVVDTLRMARGQESLIIEEENLQISIAPVHFSTAHLELVVLAPSSEELSAHDDELAAIDKASGGACLWK